MKGTVAPSSRSWTAAMTWRGETPSSSAMRYSIGGSMRAEAVLQKGKGAIVQQPAREEQPTDRGGGPRRSDASRDQAIGRRGRGFRAQRPRLASLLQKTAQLRWLVAGARQVQ